MMKPSSTVIALLVLFFAGRVESAEWVFAGSGVTKGRTVVSEVDRESITRQGQFARGWVRYRFNPPIQFRAGVSAEVVELHTRWNCHSRRGVDVRVDALRGYSSSGRLLSQGPIEDDGTTYKFDTPIELAAAIACESGP